MNAFHWNTGKPSIFCPPEDANTKQYDKRLAAKGLTRADVQKRKATRVNREASLAAFVPKSNRSPR